MKIHMMMIIGLTATVLTACSSPPEPAQLDDKLTNIYLNNSAYKQTSPPIVPKNAGDHNGKSWVHSYIDLNRTTNYLNQTEWVHFFYFAHHADMITIYGHQERTEAYRAWLKSNGVTALIETVYTPKTSKTAVDINFQRTRTKGDSQ